MKIKNLGKIFDDTDCLFQVTTDSSEEYTCQHCGRKRGKIKYFTGISETDSGGVYWCKLCSHEFPLEK